MLGRSLRVMPWQFFKGFVVGVGLYALRRGRVARDVGGGVGCIVNDSGGTKEGVRNAATVYVATATLTFSVRAAATFSVS